MRRKQAQKRGRVLQIGMAQILLAGGVGYLIGGSQQTTALRLSDFSAAQTVAQRFPDKWPDAPPVPRALIASAVSTAHAAAASTTHFVSNEQTALLDPTPMVPQTAPQLDLSDAPVAPVKMATAEPPDSQTPSDSGATLGAGVPAQPVAPAAAAVARPANETRASVSAPPLRRHVAADRPGYILNDAQIASIKQRLNLTPDQEQMWPAVEVALRNMAYTHAQEARGRAASGGTQQAAVDPNAVQGLKSAAVPLILSFNDEQKEQVRSLVHVMGLDQLASEF